MKLADLNPRFYTEHGGIHDEQEGFNSATALLGFDCPVCKAHGWPECGPFRLPRRGVSVMTGASWDMSGTGAHDLEVSPSIKRHGFYRGATGTGAPKLVARKDGPPHAHFFIRGGVIDSCGDDGSPYLIPEGGGQLPLIPTVVPVAPPPEEPKEGTEMTKRVAQYAGTAGQINAVDYHSDDGQEAQGLGGGSVNGIGFAINWQDGPRGQDEVGNVLPGTGAQVEDVILAGLHRLNQFKGSPHDTDDNDLARDLLGAAIKSLRRRRSDRAARGVEGTAAQ